MTSILSLPQTYSGCIILFFNGQGIEFIWICKTMSRIMLSHEQCINNPNLSLFNIAWNIFLQIYPFIAIILPFTCSHFFSIINNVDWLSTDPRESYMKNKFVLKIKHLVYKWNILDNFFLLRFQFLFKMFYLSKSL